MELRNSIKGLKKVRQIFLNYDYGKSAGEIDRRFLSRALRDALQREISQGQIDDAIATFREVLGEEGVANANEKIGITEFLTLMQYFEETLGSSPEHLSQEKQSALLDKVSNDLYPMRKLLRIQMNGKDAKLAKTDTSHHDDDFDAAFKPTEMLILALVSHNEMKATMKRFVIANKNILKKFRLTGTNSTMTMLRNVFKDDPDVVFGPSCSSGPLGGDAELAALMTQGAVGGIIFFQDPMSAHPHQADIESLCRLALVHNTMISHNPTTALMMMDVFRIALKGEGRPSLIPSFFFNLVSPSVPAYRDAQKRVIQSLADEASSAASSRASSDMMALRRSEIARMLPAIVHSPRDVPDDNSGLSSEFSTESDEVHFPIPHLTMKQSVAHGKDESSDDSPSASPKSVAILKEVGANLECIRKPRNTSPDLHFFSEHATPLAPKVCPMDNAEVLGIPQDNYDETGVSNLQAPEMLGAKVSEDLSASTIEHSYLGNSFNQDLARNGLLKASIRTSDTFRSSSSNRVNFAPDSDPKRDQVKPRRSLIMRASRSLMIFKPCRSSSMKV